MQEETGAAGDISSPSRRFAARTLSPNTNGLDLGLMRPEHVTNRRTRSHADFAAAVPFLTLLRVLFRRTSLHLRGCSSVG